MKRYLKTSEEVVQALKKGRTVETDIMYYVLKDGLLNCYAKNKTGSLWSVNPAIYETDRPYVDEPEQLKLEVGKFYRLRNDRKAIVVNINKQDISERPVFVAVIGEGNNSYWVSETGKFSIHDSGWDFVAPWEE